MRDLIRKYQNRPRRAEQHTPSFDLLLPVAPPVFSSLLCVHVREILKGSGMIRALLYDGGQRKRKTLAMAGEVCCLAWMDEM